MCSHPANSPRWLHLRVRRRYSPTSRRKLVSPLPVLSKWWQHTTLLLLQTPRHWILARNRVKPPRTHPGRRSSLRRGPGLLLRRGSSCPGIPAIWETAKNAAPPARFHAFVQVCNPLQHPYSGQSIHHARRRTRRPALEWPLAKRTSTSNLRHHRRIPAQSNTTTSEWNREATDQRSGASRHVV